MIGMSENKIKAILPYAGFLVIAAALFFARADKTDMFTLFLFELAAVFGYFASIFDLKTKKIPNKLIIIMICAWAVTMMPKIFLDTGSAVLILKEAGLGFLAGGGLFLFVYLVSRKGLGGGDVKFMAAAGLYMGFTGILSAMLYGSVLAALAGLVLLLLKKIEKKDPIPLAPFLYAGILMTIFWI
jgi:leader peptidase (prepilin peptidase)/N-methyltransferase